MTTRRVARLDLVVAVLVVLALGHGAYAAWRQSWTYDERFHLEWAERLLLQGETERTSRLVFNSKTPIMLPHVIVRRAVAAAGIEDGRVRRFAARSPNLLFLAALFAAVFLWVREFAGREPALVAVATLALDPNLMAHASVATVDVPYALATVVTLWAGARCAQKPTLFRGILVGVALGTAFATKFTAPLLVAGLLGLPFCARRAPLPRWIATGLAAVGAAWITLCAAYLFKGLGEPLGELLTRSVLSHVAALAPALPAPFPAPFLTGLDITMADEAQPGLSNPILFGRLYPEGTWAYFLACWVVKTPLLLAGGMVAGLVVGCRLRVARSIGEWRLIAWNLAVCLFYFSFLFRVQVGFRFVLMCVPLLAMLAAPGLARLLSRSTGRWWAVAILIFSVGEMLPYVGNPLSFTNLMVQPKKNAFRWIADSNLSWGQNREGFSRLVRELPAETSVEPPHLLPGRNLLDVNSVAGVWDFEQHRWLRKNLSPVRHRWHTYLEFDITDAQFERFLREERSFAANDPSASRCGDVPEFSLAASDPEGMRWARSTAPHVGEERRSTVCLTSREGVDLRFRLETGLVRIGHGLDACAGWSIARGQEVWFRLAPGSHRLCLVELLPVRPGVPGEASGIFSLQKGSASLALREERRRAAR